MNGENPELYVDKNLGKPKNIIDTSEHNVHKNSWPALEVNEDLYFEIYKWTSQAVNQERHKWSFCHLHGTAQHELSESKRKIFHVYLI